MSLKYDGKADLWSIGTIIYLCLTNKAPFSAVTPQALKQYYENNPRLQPNIPLGTSKELKDLLFGLLRYDPKDRMEFDEFFNHPFLKQTPKKLALKNQKPNKENYVTSPSSHQKPSLDHQSPNSPSSYGSRSPIQANLVNLIDTNEENEDDIEVEDFVIVESPDDRLNSSSNNSKESPNGGYYLSKLRDKENLMKVENLKQLKRLNEKEALNKQHQSKIPETPPEPIPVPSQKEAFEKMKRSFNLKTSSNSNLQLDEDKENNESSGSETNNSGNFNSKFMADITQMSPPTVQFCIGTPPPLGSAFSKMSTSRRRSGPIALCGSPTTTGSNNQLNYFNELNSPGCQITNAGATAGLGTFSTSNNNLNMNFQNCSPPASPILKTNRNILFNSTLISPNRSPKADLNPPRSILSNVQFPNLSNTTNSSSNTTPTNNQLVRSSSLTGANENNFKWMLHSNEGNKQFKFANCFANKLALTPTANSPQQQHQQQPVAHQFNLMHNFNHSHLHHPYHPGHLNSPQSHKGHFHYFCSNQFVNNPSLCTNFFPMFNQLTHGSNDQFEMPGLQEETLLEKEHNETLAKLNFIVALVECIINLAESRANPVSVLTESTCREVSQSKDFLFTLKILLNFFLLLVTKRQLS